MISWRSLSLLAFTLLTLTACGEMRESLGLGRNQPDEFAVVDRPPLSMPPEFGLRPPAPGAPRPQEVNMSQRANDVLFPGNSSGQGEASDSEKALMTVTGATKADPNIREVVDREAAQKAVASKHLVEELLWWKPAEKPATTVDAPAEAARLKEAKDKGEPLNQGLTPVIEREKGGFLGL